CAFLTYFTPDSTTASTSPTALTTTAAAASILNDKQALTGILFKAKTMTNLTPRKRPYMYRPQLSTVTLVNSIPYWFQRTKSDKKDCLTSPPQRHRLHQQSIDDALSREFSLNKTTFNTTFNNRKQHQCSSEFNNKASVSKL
ncbi:uncharacterized protein LOC119610695, partial [Lucilia sericata]|uniref:uncharacterized protein LOC119610695 n=1 Tax=Lucilia sericata TaxID=13632 RepID=UPI0018A833BC